MSTVVWVSQAVNLGMGFAGACAAWGLLRFLDWVNGTKFTTHLAIIDRDPMALAVYRGARFAAVLIFVALILK